MDSIEAKNLLLVFLALLIAQVIIGGSFLLMEARNG